MKKHIQQAWLIFLLGIAANISIFSKTSPSTTGWNYDDPSPRSCFEIQPTDTVVTIQKTTNPAICATIPVFEADAESAAVIQSIQKPDNITEEEIDPQKDQIIRCPQGSIVHVEANTLVNNAGEIVTEPVKIRVKECYKLKDIIANKLTTSSEGRIIETAGMVEITATAGEETLSIASGEDVDIAMPAGAGERYELFNGAIDENGVMNWILDEDNPVRMAYLKARSLPDPKAGKRGEPLDSEVNKLFATDTTCQFGITHFILEETAGNYEMHAFNFVDGGGKKLGDFFMDQFKPDKKTLSNACTSNQQYSVTMQVDPVGKLKHPEINGPLTNSSRKNLQSILKNLPVINRSFFDPITNGRERLKIVMGNLARRNEKPENLKTSDSSNETWASIRSNWVVDYFNQKKLSYYVMSSMRLGWINCDRFSNYAPAQLSACTLEIENKQVDEVMVVFETTQSAMMAYRQSDGTFITAPIPMNSNIKLVCMINDDKHPSIFTYGILSGKNKKFVVREKQKKGERDPGEEINTPA